jgi:pimeloyl-ACP methyl ester carboxylesterase
MLAVVEAHLAAAPGPDALIGSSLGGYLAAVAASRNPRIERLVLLVRGRLPVGGVIRVVIHLKSQV